MKYIPSLDKNFQPMVVVLDEFNERVLKEEHKVLKIYLERTNGYNYIYEMNIFANGHEEENYSVVERVVKSLLWMVGGFRIAINGDLDIYARLAKDYCIGGTRGFDVEFMSKIYEHPFEVDYLDVLPELKSENKEFVNSLKGCRIGFDAGGSDRKVSAVVDGKVLYSEETVWFPKLNTDPQYHYDGILDSMKKAASYMPRVDAIGVSSAGVYVDNKIMAASLFVKVNEEDFNKHVKNMYIDVAKEFGDVPLVVANDGDVTALAGALELHDGEILGIAMGTSEAAGYVDKNQSLLGWLNELAFASTDFNKNSLVDEWSGDYGCGCKYFSQDAVIKLAGYGGLDIPSEYSLAEKLKYVQKLNEEGNEIANQIFENIGIYLGYTIAYYAKFYKIKHVLLLGRVVSGKGGNTILDVASKVLADEYPQLNISLSMPDESNRRVGQSIAAAMMPTIE